MGQAAGLAPGKGLSDVESAHASAATASAAQPSTSVTGASTAASTSKAVHPPVMAGGQSWRLATAGGDNNARLWMVHPNIPSPAAMASAASVSGSAAVAPHAPRVEYLATLSRHSGVVNVVRFCPKGELLATAGDDGNVLFWVPSDRHKPGFGDSLTSLEAEGQFEKEFWRVKLMTRATQQELYDMSWSPNGETLAVGGTDFVARIINVQDGSVIREISEHCHYIQGIAWDPLNAFIATQSSDRTVHVHNLETRKHDRDSGEVTIVGSQLGSKNSKLDLHRRNGSAGGFIWDSHAKPPLGRRASSHASQASDGEGTRESFVASLRGRSKRSSTPIDPAHISAAINRASTPAASSSSLSAAPTPATAAALTQQTGSSGTATGSTPTIAAAVATPAGRAATPTPGTSVPPSPFSANAAAHAMNPPQMTPSRRSSFSGSNIDVGSPPTSTASLAPASTFAGSHGGKLTHAVAEATNRHCVAGVAGNEDGRRGSSVSRSASRTRSIRSPSPIPPLPAIRAPPSPKQRMQAAAVGGSAIGGPLAKASMRLYGDENFSGFFRRLSFSPDGALLVTPSGLFDPPAQAPASPTVTLSPRKSPVTPSAPSSSSSANKSAVYLYARGNLSRSNQPIAVLPGHKTATLVVRFSPILYELRRTPRISPGGEDEGIAPHPTIPLEAGKQKSISLLRAEDMSESSPTLKTPDKTTIESALPTDKRPSSSAGASPRGISVIGLPYRMVYAVATQDSVWIYDTQQTGPICCFSNMHYASFTDLTWSPDGQSLMMSSTDGYCSVVVFDYAELGTPYALSAQPALRAPAPGVPAPAHIAEGKSTGSAPNTPKISGQATLAPLDTAGGNTLTPTASASAGGTGLGLAIGKDAGTPTLPPGAFATASSPQLQHSETAAVAGEAPKKKRRIALTLESPLGQ